MSRPLPPWLRRVPEGKGPGYLRGHAYCRAKALATPAWLTAAHRREMADIYRRARETKQHVDHIVPLRSPIVCGLHVPWNLQLLPPGSNGSKSNHLWPGHPNEPHCWVGPFEPQQLRLKL